MSVSRTDICNQALNRIGQNQITDFFEDSSNAGLCRSFYESLLDEVLRMHPWRCALEMTELAQLSEEPAFTWSKAYQLPSSPWCLRVIRMEDLDQEFEVQGRKLLTNFDTAKILYIKRVTETAELDPWVVRIFVNRLAAELAEPIAQSESLRQAIMQELERTIIPQARNYSAQEQNMPDYRFNVKSSWNDSRFNGTYQQGTWRSL